MLESQTKNYEKEVERMNIIEKTNSEIIRTMTSKKSCDFENTESNNLLVKSLRETVKFQE